MSGSSLITVLGATGHVGSALVHQLLAQGRPVRAVARPSTRLDALARAGAQPAAGELSDVSFLTEALRGAGAAFLMMPPNPTAPDVLADMRRTGTAIARAVEAAGLRQALHLSSSAADAPTGTGPTVGLHEQEARLSAIPGLAVAHLRPAFFMENLLANVGLLRHQGLVGSVLRPDLALSMVATRDIAARAAELLLAGNLTSGARHYVLGPRQYTFLDVAATLGQALGRPGLPYVQFSYEDGRRGMLQSGMSESMADLLLEMNRSLNEGRVLAQEPRDAASTTPTTLAEFARLVFVPAFEASAAVPQA